MTPIFSHSQESDDRPLARHLAELITSFVRSRDDEAHVNALMKLTNIIGDSPDFEASIDLIDVVINGLSSRPNVTVEAVEQMMQPLVWGLLDRARF